MVLFVPALKALIAPSILIEVLRVQIVDTSALSRMYVGLLKWPLKVVSIL
jgi:hypothetical protein